MSNPRLVARAARRELERQRRPVGQFDASRYFRSDGELEFFNVGTETIRRLAVQLVREHPQWGVDEALFCAEILIADRVLDVKQLAVEIIARYHRQFTPALLPIWKRWLASDYANNWATTDALSGAVIAKLLERNPELIPTIVGWSAHRNLWVRRAAAVSLVSSARRGKWLDAAYDVVRRQQAADEDLIHKAVGWLLREAGKTDMPRLERYLLEEGPELPRTTVRYAIERFGEQKRRRLLAATRGRQRPPR